MSDKANEPHGSWAMQTLTSCAALTPPVTEITVSEWEKGATPIPSTQLLNLTKLFRCSADYLLGLTDERTPMTVVEAKRIRDVFCQDCTLDYLLESDSPAKPTI